MDNLDIECPEYRITHIKIQIRYIKYLEWIEHELSMN